MTKHERLGVGIVGCGAITQACHLPALRSLAAQFRVVHCVDADASIAAAVADRAGADRSGTDYAALLADPSVEVVAVCVPSRLHAQCVLEACEARVRAVLCEKPLTNDLDEADEVVAASERTGVPVLVATMHRHDPVARRMEALWGDLAARARLVRSTMYVPPNGLLAGLATQLASSPRREAVAPPPPPDLGLLRSILPGAWASTTFVHHLPLFRMICGGQPERVEAAALGASGAQVSMSWDGRCAQMSGIAFDIPAIDWSFEVWAEDLHLRIEFPPSFLAGQSAIGRLWRADGSGRTEMIQVDGFHETGYRAEWAQLARVARGEEAPLTPARAARQDVEVIARIADAGRKSVRAPAGGGT